MSAPTSTPSQSAEAFLSLLRVMETLRGPKGCPWDKKQTHQSLIACLLEETYEVMDAIQGGNPQNLKEELGDLLLQVIFHTQIASENGAFTVTEVLETLSDKLIRRHPHVFSNETVEHAEEAIHRWEKIKAKEKCEDKSILSGVPPELPALLRAYRIGSKASRVGFDWTRLEDVQKKLDEEIQELKVELQRENLSGTEEELGDLLFTIAQIARFLNVNPEEALRKSTLKFQNRFEKLEQHLKAQGKEFSGYTLEELDDLWEKFK